MQPNKTLFFGIVGLALVAVVGMFGAWFYFRSSNPIEVSVLYSTEKEAWLNDVIAGFEGQANGRPVELNLKKMVSTYSCSQGVKQFGQGEESYRGVFFSFM